MKPDPGTTELPSPHTPHPVQTGGVHVINYGIQALWLLN
jgi:hypothetical protein